MSGESASGSTPNGCPKLPNCFHWKHCTLATRESNLAYRSRGDRIWPEIDEQFDAWPKVDATIKAIISEFTGNLLFVGHGSSVAGMALSISGQALPQTLSPCSLSHFTYSASGWQTLLCGCTMHLSVRE